MVGTLQPGPLRDRVAELGERVDAGVAATWEAAQRAAELESVLATLGIEEATAAHKAAKRELEQARRAGAAVPPGLEERAKAVADRFASGQRLLNMLEETSVQLGLLEVRLDAAVARIAELALRPGGQAEPLGSELEAVVGELGELRRALDGLDGGGR